MIPHVSNARESCDLEIFMNTRKVGRQLSKFSINDEMNIVEDRAL